MNLVKLLWKFSKYTKYGLFAQAILCLFWSLKEALFPFLLKNIVNTLSISSSTQEFSSIYTQIMLLIALWCFMEIAMRLQGYIASKVFPKLRGKVREYIFEKLSHRTLEYKQSFLSGDLASKVSDLPKAVEQVFEVIYLHLPSIGCAFIIGSYLLFKVSPLFGFVTLSWAFLHILLSVVFAKYSVKNTYEHAKSETELLGKISDMISNRMTSHLYTNSKTQLEYLRKCQNFEIDKANKARMAIETPKFFQSALAIVFMSSMLFLLTALWQKNKVTLGDFALVPMLSYNIVGMITWFSYLINIFLKQIGFIKAAADIEVADKKTKATIFTDFSSPKGCIEFKGVSYQYSSEKPLLMNLTFSIQPGEKIALMGDSGAGKTTLLKMLTGLIQKTDGHMYVDSNELTFVPQRPELFNTTIFENIALGHENIRLEDVVEVAKYVEADKFITDFPYGYHTQVGENGYNLSVGQAQRIVLARALLRNRKILILDESTSALDAKTEKKIFDNLREYLADKTVIIATHHPRSLSYVQRVLHLVDGAICFKELDEIII